MKIKRIKIQNFRHIINKEVMFGDRLTAISGQNGTGKSSMLGLVGQIFAYKGKGETKNNQPFRTKYSEIFKFCPEFDKTQIYKYDAYVTDGENEIKKEAKTRFVKGEGKRGRFRIDLGDRYTQGEGAIDFPVIYLGLKRLFPLAQEDDDSITVKKLNLNKEEKIFYNKYARDILILLDSSIKPQDIKSPNKEFLAMETDKYSNLGNSAGQDNIGQLLTAILSFRELKVKLGDKYKGGILLIDEVDATLYAGSQINLIKRLYKFAIDYDLQIIFTTHSLEILEVLKEKEDWLTTINFFETKDGKVDNIVNPSLSEIRNKILVQTKQKERIEKIHVLCEDEVTESWCKNLLNQNSIKQLINIKRVPIGAGTLKELSEKNHPAFKKMLFVLDGDYEDKEEYRGMPRMIFLPGKTSPEKFFYEYLNSLSESDDFWDNNDSFSKQVCFNGCMDLKNKGDFKNWFKTHKTFFGSGTSKLFSRWKKDNEQTVDSFHKKFVLEFKKIRK